MKAESKRGKMLASYASGELDKAKKLGKMGYISGAIEDG